MIRQCTSLLLSCMTAVLLVCGMADVAHAQESVCARVKIEIKQELTLERQAFDAEMRITNSLPAALPGRCHAALPLRQRDAGNGAEPGFHSGQADARADARLLPQIIDNQQVLAINFVLVGSYVQDAPVQQLAADRLRRHCS